MSDYFWETVAWAEATRVSAPPLLEAQRGTLVVEWYGRIERQLVDLVNRFQTTRNYDNKAKAQVYLEIWRNNQLTGSINVEAINALLGPAEVLATDTWSESNYFAALRDQLRKLKASQEELPPIGDPDEIQPPSHQAMGGGGAGTPDIGPSPDQDLGDESETGEQPPSQDFGPEPEEGETVDQQGKAVEEPETEERGARARR
jgi:hypothetical protein